MWHEDDRWRRRRRDLFVPPRSATPDEVLAACAVGSSVPLNAFFTISIRSATGQPTVAPQVNAALTAVEPTLTVGFQMLDVQVNDSFKRRTEIGIRMALG